MGNWTVKMESNLDKVLADITKRGDDAPAVMVTAYCKSNARSGEDNRKIIEYQRLQRREPFFISRQEMKNLGEMFREAIGQDARRIVNGAKRVGNKLVAIYRAHIDERVGRTGELPPIKQSTAIRKAKKYGTNKPIMVDTGALYESIDFRVEVIK